jgi:hypothetical protein
MRNYSANAGEELTAWLVLATFGLVPHARERIKREIQAHFADAVATHLSEGLSQDEAEAKALQELGDIHSAAKAFQKKHVTSQDVEWLHGLWKAERRRKNLLRVRFIWCLLSSILLTACLFLWSGEPYARSARVLLIPLWFLAGISLYSLLSFSHLMKNGLKGPEFWRKLLALGVMSELAVGMSISSLILFQLSIRLPSALLYWGLPVCFLFSLSLLSFSKSFYIWRKLGYAHTDQNTTREA